MPVSEGVFDGVGELVRERVLEGLSEGVMGVNVGVLVSELPKEGVLVPVAVSEVVLLVDLVGVTEGVGGAEGVSLPVGEGVAEGEGVKEGDAVAVAEGGASAYTYSASANTTEFGASMGAPIMGRAAAVVKFHSSPPLALIARMEPPAVPSTLSPAACAAVTPATGEPAVRTAHTTSPVVRLSAKALLPQSAST